MDMDMEDKGHASQVDNAAAQPDPKRIWRWRVHLLLGVCAVLIGLLVSLFCVAAEAKKSAYRALQLYVQRTETDKNSAHEEVRRLEREIFVLEEAKEDCHQELDTCYAAQARFLDALVSGPGGSNLLGQYRFQVEGDLQDCEQTLARYQEYDHEDPCVSELNECHYYLQESVPIQDCLKVMDSMSDAITACVTEVALTRNLGNPSMHVFGPEDVPIRGRLHLPAPWGEEWDRENGNP